MNFSFNPILPLSFLCTHILDIILIFSLHSSRQRPPPLQRPPLQRPPLQRPPLLPPATSSIRPALPPLPTPQPRISSNRAGSKPNGRDFLLHLEAYLARRDGVDKLLKISRYATKIILASSNLPETLPLTKRLKSFESSVGLSRKAFRLWGSVWHILPRLWSKPPRRFSKPAPPVWHILPMLCRKERPKLTIMSANGVSLSFLLLLLLANTNIYCSQATTSQAQVNGSATTSMSNEMVPLNVVEVKMMLNISRRRLNGFQICAPCTCCGCAHGTCLPSPCCYAINCNIPNRPFVCFCCNMFVDLSVISVLTSLFPIRTSQVTRDSKSENQLSHFSFFCLYYCFD